MVVEFGRICREVMMPRQPATAGEWPRSRAAGTARAGRHQRQCTHRQDVRSRLGRLREPRSAPRHAAGFVAVSISEAGSPEFVCRGGAIEPEKFTIMQRTKPSGPERAGTCRGRHWNSNSFLIAARLRKPTISTRRNDAATPLRLGVFPVC
jgi:hypothetical protein